MRQMISALTLAAGRKLAVELWDVERARLLRAFHGHRDRINSVAFSPDDRLLASASSDATILLWPVPAR